MKSIQRILGIMALTLLSSQLVVGQLQSPYFHSVSYEKCSGDIVVLFQLETVVPDPKNCNGVERINEMVLTYQYGTQVVPFFRMGLDQPLNEAVSWANGWNNVYGAWHSYSAGQRFAYQNEIPIFSAWSCSDYSFAKANGVTFTAGSSGVLATVRFSALPNFISTAKIPVDILLSITTKTNTPIGSALTGVRINGHEYGDLTAPILSAASTDQCDRINLSWINKFENFAACGNNLKSTVILRATTGTQNYIPIAEVPYPGNTYSDTDGNLLPGEYWDYRIQHKFTPFNSLRGSFYSGTSFGTRGNLLGPLPAPEITAVTEGSCDGIGVSWDWTPPVTYLSGWKIERRQKSPQTAWTVIVDNLAAANRNYFDATPTINDFDYEYRMYSQNTCGDYSVVSEIDTGFFSGISGHIAYVDHSATGTNTGINWTDAFTTIAKALNAVQICPNITEIWVATGSYFPDEGPGRINDDPASTFTLPNGVSIIGGFPGVPGQEGDISVRDWVTYPTILSGDIDKNDPDPDQDGKIFPSDIMGLNAHHVVTSSSNDASAMLDGFIITAGSATSCVTTTQSPPLPAAPHVVYTYYEECSGDIVVHVMLENNPANNCGDVDRVEQIQMSYDNDGTIVPFFEAYWEYGSFTPLYVDIIKNNYNTSGFAHTYIWGEESAAQRNARLFLPNCPTFTPTNSVTDYLYVAANGVTFTTYARGQYATVRFSDVPEILNGNLTVNVNGKYLCPGPLGGIFCNIDFGGPEIFEITRNKNGGGMYTIDGSPKVRNCTFFGNEASSGGAIHNMNSSPIFANCSFLHNSATGAGGGGIWNDASSPSMINCAIQGNSANGPSGKGGGIWNYNASSPTLINTLISGNFSSQDGGGMLNEMNCSPVLTNVTLTGNTTSANGGAMANFQSSMPFLTNTIMWNNMAGGTTNTMDASIYNDASTPTITYSIVANSGGPGNVLDSDPYFLTPLDLNATPAPTDAGDFHLTLLSPAIDYGVNGALPQDLQDIDNNNVTMEPIPYDLGGDQRFWGSNVDLGVYEYPCDFRLRKNAVLEPFPITETIVCSGTTATLVIQNVTANEEVAWYADSLLLYPVYTSSLNNFQPLVNSDTSFWGLIRLISDPMSFCPGNITRVNLTAYNCIESFTAFQNDNDAYVDVTWNVNKVNPDPPVPYGTFLQLLADGEEIYNETRTQTQSDTIIQFNDVFRHYLGPDKNVNYTLNIFKIGFGTLLGQYTVSGSTTSQQFPVLSVDQDVHPGRTELRWTNPSKLPVRTKIYRDGLHIATIEDGDILNKNYTYVDTFRNAENSLVNGETYTYCIEPYFTPLDTHYDQTCGTGSTLDIAFEASDNQFVSKVVLEWDNMVAFADELEVLKGSTVIQQLPPTATTYTVFGPIPGRTISYGIRLKKNGNTIAEDFDNGEVESNGAISGRITSENGNFAISHAMVVLQASLFDSLVLDTVYADETGFYMFEKIYYGLQGELEITPISPGFSFEPATQTVILNISNPVKTGINFFLRDDFFDEGNVNGISVSLTEVRVIPMPVNNATTFEVDFQGSPEIDSVFLNVRRGPLLMDIFLVRSNSGSFNFIDSSGIPGGIYDYQFLGYSFYNIPNNNGTNVFKDSLMVTDTFPEVYPTQAFSAIADLDLGSVQLNWNQPAANYEGFKIRRNGVLIATLPPVAVNSYFDEDGVSGASYTYEVSAFRTVNEIDYESVPQIQENVLYPMLPVPANFISVPGADRIVLQWTVPPPTASASFSIAPLDPDYNFTGFELKRDGKVIGIVYRSFPFSFTDYSGVPEQAYLYELRTFKELPDTTFYSDLVMLNDVFPVVSPPSNLTASDATLDFLVDLQWSLPANTENLDGFIIYRDNDSLLVLNSKVTNVSIGANHTNLLPYHVRSFRTVDGQRYTSDPATDNGAPAIPYNQTLVAIDNFIASDDLTRQVVMTWDYPGFVLADFVVYRDGTPIDTVLAPNRKYCDITAVPGQKYLYQLKGMFMGALTHVVADYGMARSGQSIEGQVFTTPNNIGIANIMITVTGNGFQIVTYTDSTGFYYFNDIPVDALGGVDIMASSINTRFAQNPQSVPASGDPSFTRDFISDFEPALTDNESPAVVTRLDLSVLECTDGIRIGWATNNNNYDGFEVYRGVARIAIVEKGSPLQYIDRDFSPGILQSYQVRAFINGKTKKIFTTSYSNALIPPNVLPATNLEAVLVDGGNAVDIYWSHPCDDHTYYQLKRNGEILALIEAGGPITFRDSTGVPGGLYNYSLIAVLSRNGRPYYSDPVQLTVNYPVVERVGNLQISKPSIPNVQIKSDPLEISQNYYLNHALISWEYTSGYCDNFTIYRDNNLIAILDCGQRSYRDSVGTPDEIHLYSVGVLLKRNGNFVEAERKKSELVYPRITRPNMVSAAPRIDNGDISLDFKYPTPNVDGFEVLRGLSLANMTKITDIADFSTEDTLNSYFDKTGVPGTTYFYGVKAYVERAGQRYESHIVELATGIPYPNPPAPQSLVASDWNRSIAIDVFPIPDEEVPFYNTIYVSWNYDIDEVISGFELERRIPGLGWLKIADLDRGQRLFSDIDNLGSVFNSTTGYEYRIRAVRSINNADYFSPYSNIDLGTARIDPNATYLQGEIIFVILTNIPPDFMMTATDGTESSHTELTWSFTGSADQFNVYRDGVLIETLAGGVRSYLDGDGVPGKKYVYSIDFVGGSYPNYFGADEGFRTGGGSIHGGVQTLVGGSPVEGATISAIGMVDSSYHIAEASTNSLGEFFFDELPAVGNETIYSLHATYQDHRFVENPIARTLPANQVAPISDVLFLDETAYVISGRVYRPNVACGLEGITVKATSLAAGNLITNKESVTDKDGNYSIVVDPNLEGLLNITVSVLPYQVVGEVGNQDTIYFDFHALGDTVFTNFNNFPISQMLDFEDRLTYSVELTVQTACELPISQDGFSIRIEDLDGCFSKTYKTNGVGKVVAELPPLNYSMRVEDVDNLTSRNLLALDYFRFRPNTLNLFELHRDSSMILSVGEIEDKAKQIFTYHKPPAISIISGFNYLCDDSSQPAYVIQGSNYTLSFNVRETHEGVNCPVQEGYLKISNSASTDDAPQVIQIDRNTGTFDTYTFIGGDPNVVSPHLLNITVEYFSENGSFQGSLSKSVFVEGTARIPGNDVVVSTDTLGGVVQMPIYILRDPPGDGSYSTLSAGTTITKSIDASKSNSGAAGLHFENEVIVTAIGFYTNATVKAGGGETSSDSWEYSITLNQDISTTPGDTDLDGDVIVGMGVAMQYGLQQQIALDPDDCSTIISTQVQAFGPGEINTTWYYTYKQINGLIAESERKIDSIEAGTLVLTDVNGVIEPAQAKKRFEIYRDNWKKVLEYHSVNTLPYYTICAQNINYPSTPQGQQLKAEVDAWRCDFCPRVMENYNCGNGTFTKLKDEIIWNQSLIDVYNKANTAVRNLIDDPVGPIDPQWIYDEAQIDISGSYTDIAYNNLYGVGAENITFGSGVTINKSYNAANASSRSHSNTITFNGDLSAGLAWKAESTLGFIFSQTILDFSGKFGFTANYSYEESETHQYAQNNTVEVGYTLFDDDTEGIGDQYSVTVIQGATHNHTPYFSLLGGRTSCPVEPGAITRDNVKIELFDIENQATTTNNTRRNVNPDGTAIFYLELTNLNPFGEEVRDFEVFLDNQSNENAAFVRLGSSLLGSQVFYDVTPGVPLILPLTISRGFVSYQHEDIRIGIRPYCVDGTPIEFRGEPDFISVNAYFRTPCSDVTITTPESNWVINGRDVTTGEREFLRIGIRDYDPGNSNLDNVRFEYRRLNTGEAWTTMDASIIASADLANYNDTNFGQSGRIPTYFYVWDITNVDIPDGEYQIRAVALCQDIEVETFSNKINGIIDRASIRLFGTPQPADGIWTNGDEISVSYNKNINCSLFEDQAFIDSSFYLRKQSTGEAVDATITCNNNKLIILTDDPMSTFDGETLIATVKNVADISGNVADSVVWEFRVITHPLYFVDEVINVEMYHGTQKTVPVGLFNSTDGPVAATISSSGQTWLDFPGTINVPNAGTILPLELDAMNLDVGEYSDTIILTVLGQPRMPRLVINLKVVAEAPHWQVNPAEFSEDMSMVTNYRFSDSTMVSTDSLDLISVWIEGTLRGVGNIQQAGSFHVAYLSVFGNLSDTSKILEFRIWNAAEGIEYDAYPTDPPDAILFASNGVEGSTSNPVELVVDRASGKARYIPLNQGWTWFSINTSNPDMSVDRWLQSLTRASEGDIIKTRDKFAQYSEVAGWLASGEDALDVLDTREGYMIYLENGPDTLRVTGSDADAPNQQLQSGWNWVGYPLQIVQDVDDAVSIQNVSEGDLIKTSRQDGTSAFAELNTSLWTGSLQDLRPNDGYKINIESGIGGVLSYNPPPGPAPFNEEELFSLKSTTPSNTADPDDPATWVINDPGHEYNMPLISEIFYNGIIASDAGDKLALFVGNDLRGTGHIEFVDGVNLYILTILVKSIDAQEDFTIYYYDATNDIIYTVSETLAFNENGYGTFNDPYPIHIDLFGLDIEKNDVFCSSDPSGSITVTPVGAFSPTYSWSHDPSATGNSVSGLSEGFYTVTIIDVRNIPVMREIEIRNLNSSISSPEVTGFEVPVCQGESVTLVATSSMNGAEFKWYDESGTELGTGTTLLMTNVQNSQTVKVLTLINGVCQSQFTNVMVEVIDIGSASFSANDTGPEIDFQEVTFTPVIQEASHTYFWDFGDGSTSADMVAKHTFTEIGEFAVLLTMTSPAGCNSTTIRLDYISSHEPSPCLPSINLDNTIPPGIYRAADFIYSMGVAEAGKYVEFRAGNTVELNPGFTAEKTSEFTVLLEPCIPTVPAIGEEESTLKSGRN